MEEKRKNPEIFWNKKVLNTELEKFQTFIEKKYDTIFDSYGKLHKWTVENYEKFWEELWHYFGIISSKSYSKVLVKTGPGFLDNDWFPGARLNFAENILRIRDDTIALICLDEFSNEEIVTFSDLFNEVKLFAAAFRKNGLQIGDRVACFMSNRKEAISAMLATASIGAIWGGPVPYYGARAASNIITRMEPKFLITIDSHQDNGIVFPTLDYLQVIMDNAPTIERLILLVTQEATRGKDLSTIRNCTFLEDFLNEGHAPDGTVPEIVFEQLPFNHPLCINFTSGTTGLPKAAVHSAGTIISIMRDFAFKYNMKKGDVAATYFPVGWSVWDSFIPCLALGIKIFLYCGSVFYSVKGKNIWDILDQYNVKLLLLVTSLADKMEKLKITPSPGTTMKSLKVIGIGGSPVKRENFEYIYSKVKKDVFVGIVYGGTEVFGVLSGFNMNMPVYGGEVQVPSLGLDIQCFDSKGNSVVGQRGDLVICTPAINFPIGLWKDDNFSKITEIYLSKFPGVWAQHDECWINPKTKGIVIMGRSDDTLKQKGERFGAADIYFAIHSLQELQDYICVSQKRENGQARAVLFVKMREGYLFTSEMKVKIEKKVEEELWEEYVPEVVIEVPDIPYNLNNKRMESVVREIIKSNTIPEVANIRNPESLKHFLNIPEILNYNYC